jgi:putative transposase
VEADAVKNRSLDFKAGREGRGDGRVVPQEGISEQTFYRWKAKYGELESSDAKKLKQLEEEDRKLKHVVAELPLDNRALKDVLLKNW